MQQKLKYKNYRPHYLGRLLILTIIIFLDSIAYFIIYPALLRLITSSQFLILPIKTSMTTRNMLYTSIWAVTLVGFVIASPIAGNLSDKFGRKKTLFFSFLAALVGYLLPIVGILKNSLSLIFIGRFIGGGATCTEPIVQAAVADFTVGKHRAFYLSVIIFAITTALILGSVIGSYAYDSNFVKWFNITTPFFIGIVITVINIILLILFFSDEAQYITKPTFLTIKEKISFYFKLLLNNNVIRFIIIFFLLLAAWSLYFQAIFSFLTLRFHFTANQIGHFTLYIGLWELVGLIIIFRILLNFLSLEQILNISLFIIALSFIGCTFTFSPIVQWICIVPAAVCFSTSYASLISIISLRTSMNHQGLLLGFTAGTLGLAWLIAGYIANPMLKIYLPLPFLVSAIISVTALLLAVFHTKMQKA